MPSRITKDNNMGHTRGNPDAGQRLNTTVTNAIDPTNTQSPGSGRQQYPYTYIGVVKNKDDPDRMGRIGVYIKEIHGKENSKHSVVWCDYGSPFCGGTPTKDVKAQNDYNSSQDAYGMWFPMPDVENEVLVTFVNGDLNRGVWFGGLYKQKNNSTVPEPPATLTNEGVSVGGNPIRDNTVTTNIETSNKPEYVPLARGLTRQGLEQDDVRGRSTASGTRQNVSTTYGIRTPRGSSITFDDGFKTNSDPAKDETSKRYQPSVAESGGNKDNKAKENQLDTVNTPGITDRTSEFIRLRTRSGAQILIHETEGIIYMINRDGTAWAELGRSGHIDVFGNDSVSIHSYGSINLIAQDNVNIEAGGKINIKARSDDIFIQSAGNTHLTTGEDVRLLTGKNVEILASNDINVRSDNWNQNVNLNYSLCICENQNITVGKEKKEKVVGDVSVSYEQNLFTEIKEDNVTTVVKNNFLDVGELRRTSIGTDDELLINNEYIIEVVDGSIQHTASENIINFAKEEFRVKTPIFKTTVTPVVTSVDEPPTPDQLTVVVPDVPDLPKNPELAETPTVNSIQGNSTYSSSIADRVPEHEPWGGRND